MNQKDHWEQVYSTRPTEKQGWYEPHLQTSLSWIKGLSLATDARIIDVRGGASTLVDDLLNAGYRSITVLDISKKALSLAKALLGEKARGLVTWLDGDIASVDLLTHSYELWHDRAVFHFLIMFEQQQKYRDNFLKALKPGGHLIIAKPPRYVLTVHAAKGGRLMVNGTEQGSYGILPSQWAAIRDQCLDAESKVPTPEAIAAYFGAKGGATLPDRPATKRPGRKPADQSARFASL